MRGLNIVYLCSGNKVASVLSNYVIASGVTIYSEPIPTSRSNGFAAILMNVSAGGVTNGVTITQQVSPDKENWFTPFDDDGVNLSNVISNLTSDGLIQYTPVLSPFTRFAILAKNTANISARHFLQE